MEARSYTFNIGDYRFGFNGMEADDEINGNGNAYDFGARIYDSRTGKWMSLDPLMEKQPDWSPYKAFKCSPIIFIDPFGETEFYAADGKWIGTDGVDNNIKTMVSSEKLIRKIKKTSRKGQLYSSLGAQTNGSHGDGYYSVHVDVLAKANEVLISSQTEQGETGEFAVIMEEKTEGGFKVTGEAYGEGQDRVDGLPETGDISIHSHPTGVDANNQIVRADDPSGPEMGEENDLVSFSNFEINIIVGNNGTFESHYDSETRSTTIYDKRYSAINFFDQSGSLLETITGVQADKMLSDQSNSKLRQKYETKKAKNASEEE